jgi:uncharacterized protein YjbI with pentapeptide repeats
VCQSKDGWKLFGSGLAKTVVLFGAIFTVYSIIENLGAARRAEALGRADKIEQSLRSNVIWERLWGLENLENYPAEFSAMSLQNRKLSTAFEFSKRALLNYIERFSRRDGRQTQVVEGRDQIGNGTDFDRARERNRMLKVLSEFGAAGWYLSEYKAPPERNSDVVESIDLHWIVADRSDNVRQRTDPLSVLEERDLTGIQLYRSKIACISLKNTLFDSSRLQSVSFYYANLSDASFSRASIEYADFAGATARNTNFEGAQLSGTSTEIEANTHVQLINDGMTQRERVRCASQLGIQANFTGANFKKAQITNSIFSNSVLTGVKFLETYVQDTTFRNVQADGISFFSAVVLRSSFENARLAAADFAKARLSEVSFAGASLAGASFSDTQIILGAKPEILLAAANLERANFAGARFDLDITCDLLARGGVLVTDVAAWSRAGRPLSNWVLYASERDRQRAEDCRNTSGTKGG